MTRHSSKSPEHYTPGYIVELAREVMEGIDLDPASCALANTMVRADEFFTKEQNGLSLPWRGSVFLNPPGSCKVGGIPTECNLIRAKKNCTCKLVSRFWNKLLDEYDSYRVRRALWVGFSCSQLQTLQKGISPLNFVTCFPDRRVKYMREEVGLLESTLIEGSSPPQNSYISYITRNTAEVDRFVRVFSPIGVCTYPIGV